MGKPKGKTKVKVTKKAKTMRTTRSGSTKCPRCPGSFSNFLTHKCSH
jgi:hypothetical protein